MAWFSLLLLLILFVFILDVVCFLIIVIYYVFFIIYLLLFIFSIWDGVGTKDSFFHWGWGMEVEALIRKNTRVFGGAGNYNLCWPE